MVTSAGYGGIKGPRKGYMSYSLNSLKGVVEGIIQGTTVRHIRGDIKS